MNKTVLDAAFFPIADQGKAPPASDHLLATLSLLCFSTSLFCHVLSPWFDVNLNILLCLLLLAHCIAHLIYRKSLNDPVLIFGLTLFVYSYFPITINLSYVKLLARFGTSGANAVHSWVIPAFFAANAISIYVIPLWQEPRVRDDTRDEVFKRAALIGAGISIVLSALYASINGIVIGGSVNYSDGFLDRMESGSGVLLLAAQFAVAGLAYGLISRSKLWSLSLLRPLTSLLLLYVLQGQRKYLLISALMLAAAKLRFKGVLSVLLASLGAFFGYVLFNYLGYLRTNNIDVLVLFDSRVFAQFVYYFDENVSGETPALYATTSSAYEGFIAPLPNLGDYTLSWLISVPQFLSSGIYTPATTRFTFALDPAAASQGMGYGFSLWGEAYLAGGFFAVCTICIVSILFFRWLYVRDGGLYARGNYGVIALCSLYFTLWLQRNPSAYFLKEFVVYQVAVILIIYLLATRMPTLMQRRKRTRLTPTGKVGLALLQTSNHLQTEANH